MLKKFFQPTEQRKRAFGIIAGITLLLCPSTLKADVTVDSVLYTLNDTTHTAVASSYLATASHQVSIPAFVTDSNGVEYKVVAVGPKAFASTNVSSVVFGQNVRKIDSQAFSGCGMLTNVHLNESLTEIGTFAFYNSALNSIKLPSGLKSLASGAFRETKLTSCVIPAGITSLSQQLFYACSNLKTVTLPEGVVGIEAWALVSTGLTELHLPASLTDIAGGSLGKNTSLSTITVAPGNPAYKAENGLLISLADSYIIAAAVQQGSLVIPNGVKGIGASCFASQLQLTKLVLPSTLQSIGDWAFNECVNLREVDLGVGVHTLGKGCFDGCSSLGNIKFPAQLRVIGDQAFNMCAAMTEVILNDGLQELGFASFFQCSGLKKVRVPGSVNTFGDAVFKSAPHLTEVVLEEGLTHLGHSIFAEATSLRSIKLPSTLRTLNPFALYGTGLRSIILPESLDTIGASSLYGTALSEIVVPNSVSFIDKYAFAWNKRLKKITCGTGLKKLGDHAIHACPIIEQVSLNENLMEIEAYGISSCDSLKKITVPATVATIGEYAFAYNPLDTLVNLAIKPQPLTCQITDNATTDEQDHYARIVLVVPTESLEAYKIADIWKNYFNIVGNNAVACIDDDFSVSISEIYSLTGTRLPRLRSGVNVCRMSDGTTRKIMCP